MLIQIPGTNLIRDTESMALINRDKSGLEDYLNKRRFLSSQKDEINRVKADVADIKKDISDVKQLILQLMDKGSNG